MRVLVTGATGSAGRAILNHLLERGIGPLFGTYRSGPAPEFLSGFAAPLGDGRLQLLHMDLADLGPDEGPMVDAIVHCAARRPASRCASDPAAARRDNVEAVERLVGWSRRRGISLFIHCSIHSVYSDGQAPYRETAPVRPTDLQVAAKLESETIIANGFGSDVRYVILRLPHFFGEDLPCDGVLAAFAKAADMGELRVTGNGEQTVCFIELRDLASLIATLLAVPLPSGVYNAASETVGVRALAERFQKVWQESGKAVPALRITGGSQPVSFGLNCEKLFAASPWRPRHLIDEKLVDR